MKRHLLKWGTAAIMLTMLSACGGGGGSTGSVSTSVSGVASKGPINGGTVTVYALNDNGTLGKVLGTDVTDTDGNYSVDLGGYSGNVLVKVEGGTYTDEATSTPGVALATPLQAALPGATGKVTVAVTPLTELAVQKAGTLTKANIENANAVVTAMAGVDIVGTIPVDASKTAGTSVDDTAYGLMLAAISQMSFDKGQTIEQVIADIKTDLDDDGIAQTAAPEIKTSLQTFIASGNNLSGVTDLTQTSLGSSLDFIALNPVVISDPDVSVSDITKAKKMIADFRNTILSVANYKGVGAAGMVETPFNNLSNELTTQVEPMLGASIGRLGWIIEATANMLDGLPYRTDDNAGTGNTLTLTQTGSTVTFVIKDPSNTTLDTGSITINNLATPTSGSLAGTLYTPSGNATVNITYAGAFAGGILSSLSLTGALDTPGMDIDFSQSGRKLTATFAPDPRNVPGDTDVYPTSVYLGARITTNTARFDGTLSGTFGWAKKESLRYEYWGPLTCREYFVPKTASFTGSFAERNDGVENGLKFDGTINASFPNSTTYDGCGPTTTTNFKQWSAQFDGKIEAPNRPVITAFLKASEGQKGIVLADAKYTRTDTNGAVVFLTGSWNSNSNTNTQNYSFTNQDGLKLKIDVDENLATCAERLSGTIETAGGTGLATLNNNCMPKVQYSDGYFESMF